MKENTIIRNARIYTSNEEAPWADTAVIEGDKFTYVGNENNAPAEAKDFCSVDLGGRLVLPGFIDSHTHMALSVMMDGDENSFPIWDCRSKTEILRKLTEYVKKHPFRLYYVAFFGQVEALADEKLTKADLDQIVKYRPVVLLEKECHTAWLNSKAMKMLKIREDVKDMAPGYSYYERDASGNLTGKITEMTMLPLLGMSGRISDKKLKTGILKIADYLLTRGVTTVYDAGCYFEEEKTYKLLAEMDRSGELPIRYEATYIINTPEKADIAVKEFKRYKSLYETDNIKFKTIKIMFDGTHRAHTAKLVEPYHDTGGTGGTMVSEERLYRLMSELNREGIDLHAHTVGEGASKMVLDCAERIIREQGELKIHVTLAHLETQRDEDIPRFRELGITANFTPHWHGGNDYGTAEQNAELLGTWRAEHLFRAKSMMDSGANVTFSSDEVTLQLLDRWNPFLGIETGHTRRELTKGGRNAAVFPPLSECLTIEDLIKGYTANGARVLRLDDQIGSVEAGKSADFMVLNEDLFTMDPYRIHDIVPEAVFVRGKCVKYREGISFPGAVSCRVF